MRSLSSETLVLSKNKVADTASTSTTPWHRECSCAAAFAYARQPVRQIAGMPAFRFLLSQLL